MGLWSSAVLAFGFVIGRFGFADRSVGVMFTDIAIGAVGLGFDSRAGQVGHCVAHGSLRRFLEAVLPWR